MPFSLVRTRGSDAWMRPCTRTIVLLALLQSYTTQIVGVSDNLNQRGFSHVNSNSGHKSDINYFDEVSHVIVSQSYSEDHTYSYVEDDETITVLGSPIKFDPPNLNFKQQPMGVPIVQQVRVLNINSHSSIQMLSISGNTNHFHCSFFADKVIPPGGNTTFVVILLARDTGPLENTLYIHTSAGSFRYNVEGESTPNLYRLRPLAGVRIPVNSTYNPVIRLHNPHPHTMQVLEMFSSGGELKLELPSRTQMGNREVWEIPPYETKDIIRASFRARAESNHTAYIRIKTNATGEKFMFVPLDIEVTAQPGIYTNREELNFGWVSSDGSPQSLEIPLLNSASKAITVASMVTTPVNDALSLSINNMKVSPGVSEVTSRVTVTLDPSQIATDGMHEGKILIKSKNSQHRLTVPWVARVVKGGLEWNRTISRFLLVDPPPDSDSCRLHSPTSTAHSSCPSTNKQDKSVSVIMCSGSHRGGGAMSWPARWLDQEHQEALTRARPLKLTNRFTMPVAIHKVFLAEEGANHFRINSLEPKILTANESMVLTEIGLRESRVRKSIATTLHIHTNITNVQIPLYVFDGRLHPFFPGQPVQDQHEPLDLGTLGMSESRSLHFALINKGPVPVVLRGWGGNITGTLIELLGVGNGGEEEIKGLGNAYSSLVRKLVLQPKTFVIFRIGLLTGTEEGEVHAAVHVSTEYEELEIPFRFRVAHGSLSTLPKKLSLFAAFPGRVSELSLKVHSSFKHDMRVQSLAVVGNDSRFSFELEPDAVLKPGTTTQVGRVIFDPATHCHLTEDCYVGFSPVGKLGHPWYLGLALPLNLGEMDLNLVHTLWNRMREALLPSALFNNTLRLDTTEVKGFQFNVESMLSWPLLSIESLVVYPLTQIGNSTFKEIVLENPSNRHPVLTHIVPYHLYPDAGTVLTMLPYQKDFSSIGRSKENIQQTDDPSVFSIVYTIDGDDPLAPLQWFGDDFKERFGMGMAANTFPVVLKPNQRVRVGISFRPPKVGGGKSGGDESAHFFASALFLRNNLTGLEVVHLAGNGAMGDFKFGNRRAGSTIHAFDVTEKHLKDCETLGSGTKTPTRSLPNLTVKRPFTARNTGLVPLWVTAFSIDDLPCEGYGFKVLDCEPFLLPANDSKRINIAFTPDFTLARVTRTLTIKTSLDGAKGSGNILYTLAATVPPHLLPLCSKSLPRPKWESYLYFFAIVLMSLACLCVFMAAFAEAQRLLRYCYVLTTYYSQMAGDLSTVPPDSAHLLDLREVTRSTLQECEDRQQSNLSSVRRRASVTSSNLISSSVGTVPCSSSGNNGISMSYALNPDVSTPQGRPRPGGDGRDSPRSSANRGPEMNTFSQSSGGRQSPGVRSPTRSDVNTDNASVCDTSDNDPLRMFGRCIAYLISPVFWLLRRNDNVSKELGNPSASVSDVKSDKHSDSNGMHHTTRKAAENAIREEAGKKSKGKNSSSTSTPKLKNRTRDVQTEHILEAKVEDVKEERPKSSSAPFRAKSFSTSAVQATDSPVSTTSPDEDASSTTTESSAFEDLGAELLVSQSAGGTSHGSPSARDRGGSEDLAHNYPSSSASSVCSSLGPVESAANLANTSPVAVASSGGKKSKSKAKKATKTTSLKSFTKLPLQATKSDPSGLTDAKGMLSSAHQPNTVSERDKQRDDKAKERQNDSNTTKARTNKSQEDSSSSHKANTNGSYAFSTFAKKGQGSPCPSPASSSSSVTSSPLLQQRKLTNNGHKSSNNKKAVDRSLSSNMLCSSEKIGADDTKKTNTVNAKNNKSTDKDGAAVGDSGGGGAKSKQQPNKSNENESRQSLATANLQTGSINGRGTLLPNSNSSSSNNGNSASGLAAHNQPADKSTRSSPQIPNQFGAIGCRVPGLAPFTQHHQQQHQPLVPSFVQGASASANMFAGLEQHQGLMRPWTQGGSNAGGTTASAGVNPGMLVHPQPDLSSPPPPTPMHAAVGKGHPMVVAPAASSALNLMMLPPPPTSHTQQAMPLMHAQPMGGTQGADFRVAPPPPAHQPPQPGEVVAVVGGTSMANLSGSSSASAGQPPANSPSIMQQLFAERLQREQEYLRNNGQVWPGFGPSDEEDALPHRSFLDNLWDPQFRRRGENGSGPANPTPASSAAAALASQLLPASVVPPMSTAADPTMAMSNNSSGAGVGGGLQVNFGGAPGPYANNANASVVGGVTNCGNGKASVATGSNGGGGLQGLWGTIGSNLWPSPAPPSSLQMAAAAVTSAAGGMAAPGQPFIAGASVTAVHTDATGHVVVGESGDAAAAPSYNPLTISSIWADNAAAAATTSRQPETPTGGAAAAVGVGSAGGVSTMMAGRVNGVAGAQPPQQANTWSSTLFNSGNGGQDI